MFKLIAIASIFAITAGLSLLRLPFLKQDPAKSVLDLPRQSSHAQTQPEALEEKHAAGMATIVETHEREIQYKVSVPVYETHTKEVNYTVMVPVRETRVKQVPYTVMKTEIEEHPLSEPDEHGDRIVRSVKSIPEAKLKAVVYNVTLMVPEQRTKTVTYKTCRFVTETRKKTVQYTTTRMVPADSLQDQHQGK